MNRLNRQIIFEAANKVAVISKEISKPLANEVLLKSLYSAISTGSERLALSGKLSKEQPRDADFDWGSSNFEFPFSYGYSCVGIIEDVGKEVDPSLIGQRAFSFSPHACFHTVAVDSLKILDESISPMAACFLPNLETSVGLVMDTAPILGERGVVIGLGIVGQLVFELLRKSFPTLEIEAMEVNPWRRRLSGLESQTFSSEHAGERKRQYDFAIDVSGSSKGFNTALQLLRPEGRLIAGSWFGDEDISIRLDTHFHRSKIQIISSQVSSIAAPLSGRFDKSRRWEVTLGLLQSIDWERYISHKFNIEDAAKAYELILNRDQDFMQIIFNYEE